jgi:AmmeMemoRadiSam system protein A
MTESEKLTALRLARNAIESELLRTPLGRQDQLPTVFGEDGAVFVTIKTKEGALRGCVGSLIAHRSLFEDIIENSMSSAFRDPRFPPLNITELPFIKLELSLLQSPTELIYSSPTELLSKIVPFEDGLIIKYEEYQATFLPSVWEEIPSKEEFISRLCQKAGLEADFWKSGKLEIYVYKAEKIIEQ